MFFMFLGNFNLLIVFVLFNGSYVRDAYFELSIHIDEAKLGWLQTEGNPNLAVFDF